MALPKVTVPEFELEIPGIKEKATFRPFLVKEHKLLTLALESGEIPDQVSAIKQVIKNCCNGKLKVEDLALYQLQWIFLKLKSKSVGDTQAFVLTCGGCQNKINYDMNLNDFEIAGNIEESSKKIELSADSGIVFKYPSASVQANSGNMKDEEVVYSCIDYIYDSEEVTRPEDISKEELMEWLDELPMNITEKIGNFFENIPALGHKVEYTCNECNTNNVVSINGYEHFFV